MLFFPKRHGSQAPILVRQALKARPRVSLGSRWDPLLRARRSGILLTLCAAGLVSIGAFWGIRQWYKKARQEVRQLELLPQYSNFSHRFRDRWTAVTPPPPFTRGDEPELRGYLIAQPLLAALLRREEGQRVWIRQGDRLIPEEGSGEAGFYRKSANTFWLLHASTWFPGVSEDPDYGRVLTSLSGNQAFVVVRRVTPGSEAFDRELQEILGPRPPVRIGLWCKGALEHSGLPFVPFRPTRFQALNPAEAHETFTYSYWSRDSTSGWHWIITPSPRLKARMWGFLIGRMALAILLVGLILGLFALRVWIKRRLQRRAALANDCLASLTHGLQTPLAVLKARCDSLRFGRMDRDSADYEMQRLGEEVQHLARTIDQGVAAIQNAQGKDENRTITQRWLRAYEQTFGPILQRTGRTFQVCFQGEGGPVALTSLKQIIWTLLENALKHGAGTVTFTSRREGNRLLLTISDEGRGLDAERLETLGQPFQSQPHHGGKAAFRPGLGLGLSLAIQIAKKEGWGLSFTSEPGRGLSVELELTVA